MFTRIAAQTGTLTSKIVELASDEGGEHDLDIAEPNELVRPLEQTILVLGKGNLPVDLVLNQLQLHPPPRNAYFLHNLLTLTLLLYNLTYLLQLTSSSTDRSRETKLGKVSRQR